MPKTIEQISSAWERGMQGAQQKMREGVEAVTVSPGQRAAEKVDTWQARVSSQEAREKYIRRNQSQNLSEWKQAFVSKGLGRVGAGATAAKPKFSRHMQAFYPHVLSVAEQVRAMPNITLEDRIARAAAQIRGNAAFRGS